MSFFQVFRILWVRLRLILGVATACLLAAAGALFFLPVHYSAESRVVLDVIKPDPVTNDLLNSTFARAFAATQAELITDYGVALRVVQNLGWDKDPDLKQEYLAERTPEDGDFDHWLAGLVISGTSADLVQDTNILSITYVSNTPANARTVAEALRSAYIEEAIAQRRDDASRNAEWFEAQAETIRQQVSQLEKEKADFERRNNIVLQDDLTDPDSDRLKALASAPPPMPGMATPGSSPAATQLAQLDAQIVAQGAVLGPNHPDLIALKQQRAAVAAQAAKEQSAIIAASRGGPSTGSQVAQAQNKVLAQRDKVDSLRQLAARIAVLRDQYQKTAARAADLQQQANARESGVTSMGPATGSDIPTSPRYKLILGGALAGGLVLGVMLALLLELINRRVRGPDDLSSVPVPLLGIISADPNVRAVAT